MTLRSEALAWLRDNGWNSDELVRVSKLYLSEQSWTSAPAWWFEFPEAFVTSQAHSHINLLCESGGGEPRFRHLRIPVSFINERRSSLGFREQEAKFSLFLSAEPDTLFQELRGTGKVDLAEFEVVAE